MIQEHNIPDWMIPLYEGNHTYYILYGGRGGGKSFCVADYLIISSFKVKNVAFLCCRELQDSLKDSVHFLLSKRIESMGYKEYFKITREGILNLKTGVRFLFTGLWQNTESIKSIPDIRYVWIEEAAQISKDSWDMLVPTVTRNEGCQIVCTFNPEHETDIIYKTFVGQEPPPDSYIQKVLYCNNPFPMGDKFFELMDHTKKTCYEDYLHIYEGECKKGSDAQVFKGRFNIIDEKTYKEPENVHPYYGLDFGFSPEHPTAGIRCYIQGDNLYITHEAYAKGMLLKDTAEFLKNNLPGLQYYTIYADSARPDNITHLKKVDKLRIKGVEKGKGSVEDGIDHLKSFNIFIHPRCIETLKEFKLYSYKVDARSGDIMRDVEKKHDHCIDALRYALERCMKRKGADWSKVKSENLQALNQHWLNSGRARV